MPDALNAAWYAAEGNWEYAALSGAAAIPGLGYFAAAAQGAKYAKTFYRGADIAANIALSGYLGAQGVREGNAFQVGVAALGLGINAGAIARWAPTIGGTAAVSAGRSAPQSTRLYSYFEGSFDPSRPFTASSGRVYLTSASPGEWLTQRGPLAGIKRFTRTGRFRTYSSGDTYFTTGLVNPTDFGFTPVRPRIATFWKTIGGQYHTRIGISGFQTAGPGSNVLVNLPIASTRQQVLQAYAGLGLESTADITGAAVAYYYLFGRGDQDD